MMIKDIATYIDYTALKPDTKKEDIINLCNKAKEYCYKSVCVNPYYVKLAKELLAGSEVLVCTVIGFPLGMTYTEVKKYEAELSIKNGADEIDMVINIGALKNKEYNIVKKDIKEVVTIAKKYNVLVKVIIETCLLTTEEKEIISKIIVDEKADFVKTSTGFSIAGASIDDIKLIRNTISNKAMIKASGGIRDFATACDMIKAGADRIGVSSVIIKK